MPGLEASMPGGLISGEHHKFTPRRGGDSGQLRTKRVSDGYAVVAIVATGILRLWAGASLGFRPFDDTYISFRYAINLAAGRGFVYNSNEWVLGTTTPLWTLVLAAMSHIGIPIDGGALMLSLAADVATAVLIWRILARLEYSVSVSVGAAILFLCAFDYFSLARSGMETSFFVLLVMATLYEISAHRFTPAGLLCGLSCLARPEGLVLVIVLLVSVWRRRDRVTRPDALGGIALLLLVIGCWAVFAGWTFGSVVPQSILAKAATTHGAGLGPLNWSNLARFFLKGQPGGDVFVSTWLQLSFVVTLLAAVAIAAVVRDLVGEHESRSEHRALVLLVFPAAYVGGLAVTHAFTFWPWYYGPIYPFAAVLATIGASYVLRRWTDLVVAVSCAILIVGQLAAGWLVKLPNDRSFWVDGYVRVATMIPRDERIRVAGCEIGALGWTVWPSQVIDLVGIVTPQALGAPADLIVRLARPEFIVFRTDNVSCFLSHTENAPWFARDYTLVAAIADPSVAREFRAYKLNLPAYGSGPLPEPLRVTAAALGLLLFREHLAAIGITGALLLLTALARLTIARK
jgi:hypothetical protein